MMRFRLVPALAALVLTAVTAHGAAVTVRDPAFGLPHFYADTDLELARENGRQIARDRLVQMILLGRTGRGTIYQPFGVLDASTLQDDIEARRTAYTSSELYQMFDKLPAAERAALIEYCKGVNDTIDQIYATTLPEPLEVNILRNVLGLSLDLFGTRQNISDQPDPCFALPGVAPGCYGIVTSEWPNAGFQFTPEVVVSIAILEVRNFGLGGFDEASLLAQLQALVGKHGAVAGAEIWDDLNFLVDPLAPVTVPDPTTPGYGGPLAAAPSPTRLAAVAQSYPAYDYRTAMQRIAEAKARRAEFATRLGAWPMLGSYAWVIAGDKTATGYPWVGGFPQTGIQTPSLMHFAELRSAEGASHQIEGNGMEFAGAGPVILIGHTDSVAYTTTTAQLRIIDTFFEHVINENSDVLRYSDEGTPAPLQKRTETFLGGLAPTVTRTFWRTHQRGTDKGSRAINDFIGDKEGTADSGSASSLVDAGAFDAGFAGGHVAILDGTGAGQIRPISAVPDANTLTVAPGWTTNPNNTSVYIAVRAGNTIMAAAFDSPTWLEETTAAIGFINQQRAETVLDIRAAIRTIPSTHNFFAGDNKPWNTIGTASGLAGNIGYWSSGFSRKRQGGLDSRLPMDGSSATNPLIVASGTVTSATATSVDVAGGPFTGSYAPPAFNYRYQNPTQQGSEFIVAVTTGTGAKQTRRIASNTPSSITIEFPWGVIPGAGDTVEVSEIVAIPEAINPSEGYVANWNNKAATADEGDNFGRQFRHIFILEQLASVNGWDRDMQRQLNKDVAGLDGRGDFGRFLIPRIREAVNRVGNGGNADVDSVLSQLEGYQGQPLLGRFFVDPVSATTRAGEVAFLNTLIGSLAQAIYGDEYGGAVGVPGGTNARALNIVQHAIDSKAGDPPGAYEQAFGGDYFLSLDHFLCYKAATTAGTPRFQAVTVSTADDFETANGDAKRPKALCEPANKADEGVRDTATHLESYIFKSATTHTPQTGVVVRDQFGTLTLDTIKPDRLLVPSGKALNAAAPAPTGSVDHFKCYKVRRTPGTARFVRQNGVKVVDHFENRFYDVIRPLRLCLPVSKNAGSIIDEASHLVCYKTKAAAGGPAHTRVQNQIRVNNQFGTDQRLNTIKEDELCVPATRNPGNTQGWEVLVRDTFSTLASGGVPADSARPNSTYNHPLAGLLPALSFPPTPSGNRGTWEQIVDVGPVVTGEFIFPLGQSGHIEGTIASVTLIDPNFTTLHPLWRDWRFAPMIRVSEDLASVPTGDSDLDGVLDGYERWYLGTLAQGGGADSDGDGATLVDEYTAGSDPTDPDTDDDGIADGADSKPQDRLLP